jgi:hypothetical protein
MLQERDVKCRVIGKDIKRGFLRSRYKIALELIDESVEECKCRTTEINIPFHQYCQLEVGKDYMFTIYSNDGTNWKLNPNLI